MKRITIIPYVRKAGVKEIVVRSVAWLEDHGVEIRIPQVEAEQTGLTKYAAADEDLFNDVELALVLGGDGTALRAVRLMRNKTVPVLSVNLGEKGFLMWVKPEDIEAALASVHAGDFRVEERHMLKAVIHFIDGRKTTRLALNDVLVGREEFSRLIKLDVIIQGKRFCTYSADGVLLTTATGSTAYAFSAGGPVISPAADVFALVPICAHSLNNKSLVFGAQETLTIKPLVTETLARTGVSIDGVIIGDSGQVSAVDIQLAEEKFKFISLNGPDFYQSLGQKLKGWLGL